MLLVISPAKSLDYQTPPPLASFSIPEKMRDSALLIEELRKMAPPQLAEMMSISTKLADLNFGRYLQWKAKATPRNAAQAIFVFTGDVYQGLDARTLDEADIAYAQEHLRILSGLYGLLRPLDLMQPYRLEMGTRLATERGATLYDFWGDTLTGMLNKQMKLLGTDTLLNLASNEYFTSVRPTKLKGRIVSPVFKDYKSGQYKIISFFAKKARGYMSRWVIQNRIESPDQLPQFAEQGYRYSAEHSRPDAPVFLRDGA